MYHLVLTVCLAANIASCKTVELAATMETFTPMQCFTAAKSEVTRWARDNPAWRVQRWKCEGKREMPEPTAAEIPAGAKN